MLWNKNRKKREALVWLHQIVAKLIALCGLLSIATLTIEYGFYYNREWGNYIWIVNSFAINYLLLYEIIGFIFTTEEYPVYIKNHKPELVVVALVLLQKIFEQDIVNYLHLGEFGTKDTALLFLSD